MSDVLDLKVSRPYTEYVHRGLRLAINGATDPLQIGDRAVVFDRDLNFTQHRVIERDRTHVTLGQAIEWPIKEEKNA